MKMLVIVAALLTSTVLVAPTVTQASERPVAASA